MALRSDSRAPSRALRRLPLVFALLGALVAPVLVVVDVLHQRLALIDGRARSGDSHWAAWSLDVAQLAGGRERSLLQRCKCKWFTQTLDHFNVGAPTYEQRYFVCDEFYRPGGVMFFYVGNEADVELYVNHTGLMWENAAEFGAMLVFAEHRYFGQSIPFRDDVRSHMEYLSTEQALADYAVLITYLKEQYKRDIPVIGFGGSYGGMLGSWFRMKYPSIIDGVIAASAPILSFLGDAPKVEIGSFARIVTYDASPGAGSASNCICNVRRAWTAMAALGAMADGRKAMRDALHLCGDTKLDEGSDVIALMQWAKASFDYMSMGNYPYPSSYIMNGQSELPAYPMRAACSHLSDEFPSSEDGELSLLRAFAGAIGVYYNSSQAEECFDLSASSNESARDTDMWQYLYCSELYQPQKTDGVNDMFWPMPWNQSGDNVSCRAQWGIDVHPTWASVQYGGRKALAAASNIVFSNGNLDPWSGTGVLESVSDSVVAISIDGGAHHLDLMFSHPLDTASVRAARATEREHVAKWIREFYDGRASSQA